MKVKTKMKTHRGAAKRFRVTANGHLKRAQENLSHIMTKKRRSRKRKLRKIVLVNKVDEKRLKSLLPWA